MRLYVVLRIYRVSRRRSSYYSLTQIQSYTWGIVLILIRRYRMLFMLSDVTLSCYLYLFAAERSLVSICADVFPDEKRENDCLANLLGSRVAWVVCKKLLTKFAEASIYRLKQSRLLATSTHFWGFNKSDVKRLVVPYWKKSGCINWKSKFN